MPSVRALSGVARLPFLLLPVTLVASGAAAATYAGHFSWLHTILALLGLVSLHVAVNSLNEWSDMRSGIDLNTQRTPFSGGSGTLPAGAISSRGTLLFGLGAASIGLFVGLWFLGSVGMPLVPIIVLGAVCVLGYTDLLARIGLGELAAGLGLGGLPVIGTALVQEGVLDSAAIGAAIPSTFMTFNLLLLNEFPDEDADRTGGRRNLVIMLGRRPAALVYAAAALLTPASIVVSAGLGVLPLVCLAAAVPSVLLVPALRWAGGDTSLPVPLSAMGANVMWNLGTNTVMALALLVAVRLA